MILNLLNEFQIFIYETTHLFFYTKVTKIIFLFKKHYKGPKYILHFQDLKYFEHLLLTSFHRF